jgi:hypothetical protein
VHQILIAGLLDAPHETLHLVQERDLVLETGFVQLARREPLFGVE